MAKQRERGGRDREREERGTARAGNHFFLDCVEEEEEGERARERERKMDLGDYVSSMGSKQDSGLQRTIASSVPVTKCCGAVRKEDMNQEEAEEHLEIRRKKKRRKTQREREIGREVCKRKPATCVTCVRA